MTLTRITFAALVVTSSLGLAEEPDLTPTWSLGAGLSFGAGLFVAGAANPGGLGGLGGLGGVVVPSLVPNVSVERAFSNRFAVGLGLEAGVTTSSTVGSQSSPVSGSVAVGFSPRFTLTSPTAPVAFTVFATAFTGYSGAGNAVSILTPTPTDLTASTQSFSVGVLGGVALEKRFFERLAVRIQAQLARVSLNRSWNSTQSTNVETGAVFENRSVSSFANASLLPVPSLELRLYL